MDVKKFLQRVNKRKSGFQKYEKMNINFHKKVKEGFLEIYKKNKKRCVILDADIDKIVLSKKILEIINKRFKTNF